MKRRNVKEQYQGTYSSDRVQKVFVRKNTGDYGDILLPQSQHAISVKDGTDLTLEFNDEQSNAKTNSRNNYKPIRLKGKSNFSISTHLNTSDSATEEWPISTLLELILGKKENVASPRGASTQLNDPSSVVAGINVVTAGSLAAEAGNYATLKLVNAGASGSAAVAKSGNEFTLSYYNDSTVADVTTALDGHTDLVATADGEGTPASDLFIELVASRNLRNGQSLYFSGGSSAGTRYSNDEAPQKDATMLFNKDKTGQILSGAILDSFEIDINQNIPVIKIDGVGKRTIQQSIALINADVSAANKIYLVSERYEAFKYDSQIDSYVDVVSADGLSHKYKGLKITGKSSDGGGTFITVDQNITALEDDYVAFYEPSEFNEIFNPSNGQSGQLKVDGQEVKDIRNLKFSYKNNHQILEDLALVDTIAGFVPAKAITATFSCEVLFKASEMALYNKLSASDTVCIPVEITVGSVAGRTFRIFMRNVSFKVPDLSDKADEATVFTLEGEVNIVPDAVEIPSVVISTT